MLKLTFEGGGWGDCSFVESGVGSMGIPWQARTTVEKAVLAKIRGVDQLPKTPLAFRQGVECSHTKFLLFAKLEAKAWIYNERKWLSQIDKKNNNKTSTRWRLLPTGKSKFTRALWRIEKVLIVVATHIVANSSDALHIWTSLARISEAIVSSKSFDA